MDDDWASDGEEETGLGDISAIPEVKLPVQPPKPVESSPPPAPPVNAWTSNPSGDVRSAIRRSQPPPRQFNNSNSRQPRRDNFRNSFMSNNERTERFSPRANSTSTDTRSGDTDTRQTTLYVTNLPYDATESSIRIFFESQSVRVMNVRIIRHSDTGNIKAAFVRIPPEQNKQQALAIDGRSFGSRNIYVKIDGTDGYRRRDRGGSLGNISFGANFGAKERRENSNNGWGNGGWGDRPSASADAIDRRMGDSRDDKRRESSQVHDPTIPTGPPPAGRKKLQLKPRTKPLPVLDVDKRAINVPRAPASAPPPTAHQGDPTLKRAASGPARERKLSNEISGKSDRTNQTEAVESTDEQPVRENGREMWTPAKETGATRQPNTNAGSNKKEDDSKRPVLLNAFAALEVNDSDT